MKKYILILIVAICSFGLFGCTMDTSSNLTQSRTLEKNQEKLVQAVPIPQIEDSQERKNIAERATRWNTQNKIGYVYLVSYGKIMSFYTIKGKVSSLRSYMSPQEQLVNKYGIPCGKQSPDGSTTYCSEGVFTVQAPDVDGSYGDNTDGIFFFTTEDVYVEWKGEYLFTDEPLKLSQPVELIRSVK